MVAVSEAVSLFPVVPHIPLSHVSHGVCELDGVVDRPADWSLCDREAARISDWAVHP